MPKQFKTARQINKLKITEAAEKLNISQPTLSAWEGERKSPSIPSALSVATTKQPVWKRLGFLLSMPWLPLLTPKLIKSVPTIKKANCVFALRA